ncbi:XRE family transcriptional regulator [Macrococcus hajekii]|uniref:XRE family transcriptional regulator n=1 Tax=Macrococcus hajekii TaxID=198482 RepID=A0A4R6BIH0_9STAP|nr:helix-turn-helix transcriptional regulator [Macrococcus hajekii]TDM01435.1 XRE family transcriptional regulator [Macrococcus hajekii]GGA99962.1 hypothetical protein GCM10007190_05010 [Macrococcus hajekii]
MKKERYVKLRVALEERGIKHKEVADLIDVTVGTFSQKINRNKSNFTIDEAAAIAKHLNVTIDELFSD